jgi:cardiolipin synthase
MAPEGFRPRYALANRMLERASGRRARGGSWTALALLLLLLVGGCARPHPDVVLPRLTAGDAAARATLEAYGGSPIVDGNAARILLNGDEIFPAQLAAIRGARHSIDYAQYFWAGGDLSTRLSTALAERCRAGVGVNVLLDGFGSFTIPSGDLARMREAGCHVEFFRPLSRLFGHPNNRNHRRILVVDGRVGFTGGAGVSDLWEGDGRAAGHWRDTDLRVEGPVVRFLQASFAESWLEATGIVLGGPAYFPAPLPPAGPVAAQIVSSSPVRGDFALYTTLLLLMASARRSIMVTNPYFVPDARMTDVVLDARRRGVRVVVLVPGPVDHALVRQASRAGFGPLLRAGVEIYEYRAAMLHAKTMVVDGRWAMVGSANLDNRSFALNRELDVVLYSEEVATGLERVFAEDLRHARRIDLDAWRHRSWWSRFLELVVLPVRDQL